MINSNNSSRGLSGIKVLVTGSAGFIGFHTSKALLDAGATVVGLDSLNDYYDVRLKERRNKILESYDKYFFYKEDISDFSALDKIFSDEIPDYVIHLAAQAGIRYSRLNPWCYEKSNILGTMNIFESSVKNKVKKVLYASSSSVYGDNVKIPFSESDRTDTPISLYAASKKSCELLAHSYGCQSGIPFIGFRFFTVYGPFGRPDMAVFKFAKKIVSGKEILLNGNGLMERDFTHVDDIVLGLLFALSKLTGSEVYNLGNSNPKRVLDLIYELEKNLKISATLSYSEFHEGELMTTYADISKSKEAFGFCPDVSFEEGIKDFCEWFLDNEDWILELVD